MSSILRPWVLLAMLAAAPVAAAARPATPHRSIAPARKPAPAAGARAGNAARTLDDIHIEGEIPVPQVLFITARSQRRFLEFQHGSYLRSARQFGEATALPSRVVVSTSTITPAKESIR